MSSATATASAAVPAAVPATEAQPSSGSASSSSSSSSTSSSKPALAENAPLGSDAPPDAAPKSGDKRKWARKQAEKPKNPLQRAEGSNEYNIWYHKYLGDRDDGRERARASNRCVAWRDVGLTQGDLNEKFTPICIHFARGCCVHGPQCIFLHRLPTAADNARLDMVHDIFGREKHATDRDDMDGTGSFNREGRTLWIHGFNCNRNGVHATLEKHFGEWGELVEVAVKPKHQCCFLKYKYRVCAEFAKVAMAEQTMDHGEQLTIRWANDDPNPVAQKRQVRDYETKTMEAIMQKGYASNDGLPYEVPGQYIVPGQSKESQQLVAQAQAVLHGGELHPYPDTNQQYADYYAQQGLPYPAADGYQYPNAGYQQNPDGSYVYIGPATEVVDGTTPLNRDEMEQQAREEQMKASIDGMNALLDKIDAGKPPTAEQIALQEAASKHMNPDVWGDLDRHDDIDENNEPGKRRKLNMPLPTWLPPGHAKAVTIPSAVDHTLASHANPNITTAYAASTSSAAPAENLYAQFFNANNMSMPSSASLLPPVTSSTSDSSTALAMGASTANPATSGLAAEYVMDPTAYGYEVNEIVNIATNDEYTAQLDAEVKAEASKALGPKYVCITCTADFHFSPAEQEFYNTKGFEKPKRCKPCRVAKARESRPPGLRAK
jgi:hypothetical protein